MNIKEGDLREEPRICAAIGCGRIMFRKENETENDWRGRLCCDRACANRYRNQARSKALTAAHSERNCRYCLQPLVRREGERLAAFRRREGCGSDKCTSMKYRIRALARWVGKKPKLSLARRIPPSRRSIVDPVLCPEDDIAHFIQEHGVTRCPTAAVSVTTGRIPLEDQSELRRHAREQDELKHERNPRHGWG